VAISADGKEIYYCTNKSWKNSNDLKVKYFKYDGKKWVGPVILNEHKGQTSISSDGKSLYFAKINLDFKIVPQYSSSVII
jgi:hypothetical protein